MKIYTKSGDRGKTGIHGGSRVDKDDIRIEANGALDELNALVGVIRSMLPEAHEWQGLFYEIQTTLMVVMSQVATPSVLRSQNPNLLPEDMVVHCEKTMDGLTGSLQEEGWFVLPGGTPLSAHCHLARTVARRAERRLWTLQRQDPVPDLVLIWLNRLSDLFFVLARAEMQRQGTVEEKWKTFAYKKKSTDKK